jgi:hypothetical protein
MNHLHSITVKGKSHTWSFTFKGDPAHLADWRADGLDVSQVLNRVPAWAQQLGLTRPWVLVQDAWRFLRFW